MKGLEATERHHSDLNIFAAIQAMLEGGMRLHGFWEPYGRKDNQALPL